MISSFDRSEIQDPTIPNLAMRKRAFAMFDPG